ncbi:type II secretion system F family protein [Caulobacter sp. 602-2]|uniref:Type II secretion system F family protein n=1 Tax=Caulobacter sp. 602-2 TaxID=2710887 RepID=A0A6G4QQV6_9CAUL|nr:type II secretion system F family protein [Caulobacter sp. 602-2]NGM48036.1 type II secretion system F family protein [Caulobacter sp. 602-2]
MDLFLSVGLQVAVFLAVGAMALLVFRQVDTGAALKRRMRERAAGGAALATGPAGGLLKDSKPKTPLLGWLQAKAPRAETAEKRSRLAKTLAEAGFEGPAAVPGYFLVRVLSAVGLPAILLLAQKLSAKPVVGLPLIAGALLLCGLGLVIPAIIVDLRAVGRRERLENQFPDALDLMVVCVEAGLGVDAAFIRVSQEIKPSHADIAREFSQVSQELRAGRSRADALRRMADRVNVDALRAFAALMIQTDSLGASITQTLRSYSGELRERRFLRGEEKAMRIPVLLTIPLVACILPVIITALLLPAGLDVVHNLMPAMKRH